MSITTLSSRHLSRAIGLAKEAAKLGPVIITDRGKPSHVLVTYDEYRRLVGNPHSLVEALAMPELSETHFEPHRAQIVTRNVDLS